MAPVLEGRPGGWRICIGVLAVLVLAALALTNPAKGSASAIPSQAGEWIVLDSGQFGNQVWSVRAMHESAGSSSRSNEDRESCIWIGAERQLGKYNFHRSSFRRCDSLPARSAVGGGAARRERRVHGYRHRPGPHRGGDDLSRGGPSGAGHGVGWELDRNQDREL